MEKTKIINNVEYYSANYIFNEWSGNRYVTKQKSQFLLNKSTKILIDKYNKEIVNPCYISFRGTSENSGTWIIKELVPYFYNWLHKLPMQPITRNESQFCEILETSFIGILNFERQKIFDTFFVDLYCEKLNLCIEYDEPHHKYSILNDKKRQDYITTNYNCVFYRHKEEDNIGLVINYIIGLIS